MRLTKEDIIESKIILDKSNKYIKKNQKKGMDFRLVFLRELYDLGIKRESLHTWMNGETNLSKKNIDKIKKALLINRC